jgi:hypothetical protein
MTLILELLNFLLFTCEAQDKLNRNSSDHDHISECVSAKCKSRCKLKQSQAEKCKVEYSFPNSSVSWTNENGQTQSVDCLFDINMDTLVTNKAMFKLSCSIFLKKKDKNKLSIYLFILPPSIRTIELEANDGRVSLHFHMDRNAALVVPHDEPLEPKARSEQLLNLMKVLSLAKEFTILLGNVKISESMKSNLSHVASTFSPENQSRPGTNEEIADLKSLYNGKGGEVINATTATASISKEASKPPPYPSSKHAKSKRCLHCI